MKNLKANVSPLYMFNLVCDEMRKGDFVTAFSTYDAYAYGYGRPDRKSVV